MESPAHMHAQYLAGKLPSGFEESSDDEVDIEEDAEYRRSKLQHDKRRRMAEKVRLFALCSRHEMVLEFRSEGCRG